MSPQEPRPWHRIPELPPQPPARQTSDRAPAEAAEQPPPVDRPRPARDGGLASPWARAPQQARERTTNRHRHIVEGLPEWSPLPPGESLVRRPGTTS